MDNIRIIFVLANKYSDESEVSTIMSDAFQVRSRHALRILKFYTKHAFKL